MNDTHMKYNKKLFHQLSSPLLSKGPLGTLWRNTKGWGEVNGGKWNYLRNTASNAISRAFLVKLKRKECSGRGLESWFCTLKDWRDNERQQVRMFWIQVTRIVGRWMQLRSLQTCSDRKVVAAWIITFTFTSSVFFCRVEG